MKGAAGLLYVVPQRLAMPVTDISKTNATDSNRMRGAKIQDPPINGSIVGIVPEAARLVRWTVGLRV
jgi:hypothetical protein